MVILVGLEAFLEPLEAILEPLGAVLGPLGTLLGRSWGSQEATSDFGSAATLANRGGPASPKGFS